MESPAHVLLLRCVNNTILSGLRDTGPRLFMKLCACVHHFYTAHLYQDGITLIACCAFMYNEHRAAEGGTGSAS